MPKNTIRNSGFLMAAVIACMAAISLDRGGGTRRSARRPRRRKTPRDQAGAERRKKGCCTERLVDHWTPPVDGGSAHFDVLPEAKAPPTWLIDGSGAS